MPDNSQTNLNPWVQMLLGQPAPPSPTGQYDDQQISGFTPQNTVGIDLQQLSDALDAHSDTPAAKKKATFGDHLKQFLKGFAYNAVSGISNNYNAQMNPEAFRQNQESQRQSQLLQAQEYARQNPTAYQQRQLADEEGLNVWKILSGGATPASDSSGADFTYAGHGFNLPQGASAPNVTISKDSDIGKYFGLNQDMQVPQDQYVTHVLPALGQFHTSQDKTAQTAAHSQAVDHALQMGLKEIDARFAGSHDPLASQLRQNKIDAMNDAAESDRKSGSLSAISSLLGKLYEPTQFEKSQDAAQSRAAENAQHAAQFVETQDIRSYEFTRKELDQLQKPVADKLARIGELQDLLTDPNAVKNSLTAVKVIQVMAGGAGSGVRITQPEISNYLHGRSKPEDFQAMLQKWSTGQSITPQQLQQTRDVVSGLASKYTAKQTALSQAGSDLAGSHNLNEHRRILDKATKQIVDVDTQAPSGVIRVRRKSDGATGSLNC